MKTAITIYINMIVGRMYNRRMRLLRVKDDKENLVILVFNKYVHLDKDNYSDFISSASQELIGRPYSKHAILQTTIKISDESIEMLSEMLQHINDIEFYEHKQ